jgi:hypothetical protein
MTAALGSDLALTRFVGTTGGAPLDAAHSWGGLDLAVVPRRAGTRTTPPGLGTVSGRANLAQALVVRLLTPRGSLAPLGHVTYGSRLGELVGRRNDAGTRDLARLYALEALTAEPRVAEVQNLVVETVAAAPDTIRVSFAVRPVDGGAPVALALDLSP